LYIDNPHRGGGRRGPTITWGKDSPIIDENPPWPPEDYPKDPQPSSSKIKLPISTNQRDTKDSKGPPSRNISSLRRDRSPINVQSVLEYLNSMTFGIGESFAKQREAVGHPRFGYGAAIEGVLETPGGRRPGLIEAGLRGLGRGLEKYDLGVGEREKALRDILESESEFELELKKKLAAEAGKPFAGKYTEVVRKSLWEHAAYISGEGARFDKDDVLRYTNSGNPVGPATQRKVAELFHKLESAYAYHYERTGNEIKSVSLAKDDVSKDQPLRIDSAGGNNQGDVAGVTSGADGLDPNELTQNAPGVSPAKPVPGDPDHIPKF